MGALESILAAVVPRRGPRAVPREDRSKRAVATRHEQASAAAWLLVSASPRRMSRMNWSNLKRGVGKGDLLDNVERASIAFAAHNSVELSPNAGKLAEYASMAMEYTESIIELIAHIDKMPDTEYSLLHPVRFEWCFPGEVCDISLMGSNNGVRPPTGGDYLFQVACYPGVEALCAAIAGLIASRRACITYLSNDDRTNAERMCLRTEEYSMRIKDMLPTMSSKTGALFSWSQYNALLIQLLPLQLHPHFAEYVGCLTRWDVGHAQSATTNAEMSQQAWTERERGLARLRAAGAFYTTSTDTTNNQRRIVQTMYHESVCAYLKAHAESLFSDATLFEQSAPLVRIVLLSWASLIAGDIGEVDAHERITEIIRTDFGYLRLEALPIESALSMRREVHSSDCCTDATDVYLAHLLTHRNECDEDTLSGIHHISRDVSAPTEAVDSQCPVPVIASHEAGCIAADPVVSSEPIVMTVPTPPDTPDDLDLEFERAVEMVEAIVLAGEQSDDAASHRITESASDIGLSDVPSVEQYTLPSVPASRPVHELVAPCTNNGAMAEFRELVACCPE